MKKTMTVFFAMCCFFVAGCLVAKAYALTPTPVLSPTPVDCGTDFSCFLSSAQICAVAKGSLTTITPIDIFGISFTATTIQNVQTNGVNSQNKCSFYVKKIKTDVSNITPGLSLDEQYNIRADSRITDSFDETCLFDQADLTGMLQRWQQGNINLGATSCSFNLGGIEQCTRSGGDFANAQCSGTYLAAPIPSLTPSPGATALAFTISFHGIGSGGDNVNPNGNSFSNKSPVLAQRNVFISLVDGTNNLVDFEGGSVNYDASSGNFTGIVVLRTPPPTGTYLLKIKSDNELQKNITPFHLTDTITNTVPTFSLIAGDVQGNNVLDIVSYNIIFNCVAQINCTGTDYTASDLNNDGIVDQSDLNLFIRELSVQRGDQ